jgi:hypothetical protein
VVTIETVLFYFFAGENYSVMLNYRNNYVAIRIINSIQKQKNLNNNSFLLSVVVLILKYQIVKNQLGG